jgi:methylisocitrate lyase
MARTDAFAREGLDASLERASAYVAAGADMIFAEAMRSLDDYRAFTRAIKVPVLANLTEFGLTPYFTVQELAAAGVKLVLYPLTAFRAMSRAALDVYRTLREQGTQRSLLDKMQTRDELYAVLDYHAYERKLDELFSRATPAPKPSRANARQPRAAAKTVAKKAPRRNARKGKR